MLIRIFLVVLACAIAAACDRADRQPAATVGDEAPTPVERPDASAGADWCKQHGVPESRCAPCQARNGSRSESLGAGTCGIATTSCEDPVEPSGRAGDAAPKPLDDLKPATKHPAELASTSNRSAVITRSRRPAGWDTATSRTPTRKITMVPRPEFSVVFVGLP